MAYQAIPPVTGGTSTPVGPAGTWPAEQYDFISGLIPQLTAYQYIKAGQFPPTAVPGATTTTNDGAVEGGARTGPNAGLNLFGSSVFQACNTTRFAMAFEARMLAAAVGQTNAVGLFNAGGTHDLLIGVFGSLGGGTNYYLSADGTTSTTDDTGVANDLGIHTFVVTGDTVNLRVYIDGTLCVTRAIGTNVVDEPLFLALYNTVSTETVVTQVLYGYVDP